MSNREINCLLRSILHSVLLLVFVGCSSNRQQAEATVADNLNQPYKIRVVFEGLVGYYSAAWSDPQKPFYALLPSDTQHEAAILVNERLVEDSLGSSTAAQPVPLPGGLLKYKLKGENVVLSHATISTPLTKHPISRDETGPCDTIPCPAEGTEGYKSVYLDRKKRLGWLAPINNFLKKNSDGSPDTTVYRFNEDCLTMPCAGGTDRLLAARLVFDHGLAGTHRLDGLRSSSEVPPRDSLLLRRYKLELEDGTETGVAIASTVAVEMEAQGDLNLELTEIYGSNATRIIPINKSVDGLVEIFVVNIPITEGCVEAGSDGCEVNHFRAFYSLLTPYREKAITDYWLVPRWESGGSGGDEACPGGCYSCR